MQVHLNLRCRLVSFLTMKDDSIDGIYDTLKQTAKISPICRWNRSYQSIILDQQDHIYQEQMEHLMG